MAEGLSPVEVGKELKEHRERTEDDEHAGHQEETGRSRVITIVEAILLAIVAVLAAWSGYASAKWGTESSLELAKASAARTEANRADLEALTTKNFDSSTFEAWFTAYLLHNTAGEQVAIRRFRPAFRVAFDAWLATSPATNPKAPPGPTYMPEYEQPGLALSNHLDAAANAEYALGQQAGNNSDNYIRTTVYLATVLFLVGISGHFRVRAARVGLIVVGGAIMAFAVVLLVQAPKPPI